MSIDPSPIFNEKLYFTIKVQSQEKNQMVKKAFLSRVVVNLLTLKKRKNFYNTNAFVCICLKILIKMICVINTNGIDESGIYIEKIFHAKNLNFHTSHFRFGRLEKRTIISQNFFFTKTYLKYLVS